MPEKRSLFVDAAIIAAAVVMILLVTSCATPAPPYNAADYGPPPANAEAVVRSYYARSLVDPDSAQFRSITAPRPQYLGDRAGYLVCVTLNARNRMGGYVGFSTDALLLRDDRVVDFVPGHADGAWRGNWRVCDPPA